MQPEDVIKFWFNEISSSMWFRKDEKFDETIRERFFETYEAVMSGDTASWRSTPQGRLAEVVVLDQFARNMFRNSPKAFMGDALALELSREAIATGDDKKLSMVQRRFLYMPFMHSESKEIHKKAVWLFVSLLNPFVVWFELKHKRIIDRFGRYPHRNEILGRESTPEEEEFVRTHKGF